MKNTVDFGDGSCVQIKAQYERTFWNTGSFLYLDRGFGYMGEGICQNIYKYTLVHFTI